MSFINSLGPEAQDNAPQTITVATDTIDSQRVEEEILALAGVLVEAQRRGTPPKEPEEVEEAEASLDAATKRLTIESPMTSTVVSEGLTLIMLA